mmetsp:Transcript_6877/g.6399  ORF Transcript_6877/g.6399 Transcript_6877/m.6399 type:complete len:95 (-) Transcript_6877:262-546(-)
MQIQNNVKGQKGQYTGSYHAVTSIYKAHGLAGVMHGFIPTLMRDTIAYGAWFGTYGTLKSKLLERESNPSIFKMMLIGSISGEMYWLWTFPIDL